MIKKKYVYVIDAILLVGTLFGLFFAFSSTSFIFLSPPKENELFRFQNCYDACKLLIDDNLFFDSPEEFYLEDGLEITLAEGEYYFEIVGIFDGGASRVTTLAPITLIILKDGKDFVIENADSEKLEVKIYNEGNKKVDSFEMTSHAVKVVEDE